MSQQLSAPQILEGSFPWPLGHSQQKVPWPRTPAGPRSHSLPLPRRLLQRLRSPAVDSIHPSTGSSPAWPKPPDPPGLGLPSLPSSPHLCVTGSLRGRQPPPPARHPATQPSLQPVSRRIASSRVGNLAWMTPLSAETPGPAASNQGLWSPRRAPAHASHPTRGDFLSPRACPTL